jgi:hypothetical protein
MFRNKKTLILLSAAIITALLVSGCWLLGITLVLSYDIEDKPAYTDTYFNGWFVDLTTEKDWQDHQDNLDEIYNLMFYGWITNYENTPATGRLYVYNDTTLHTIAEVESSATLVLDGIAIPADTTGGSGTTTEVPLIDLDLKPIRDLIMKGKFALYAITSNTPFHIRVFDSSVLVIFAVEP